MLRPLMRSFSRLCVYCGSSLGEDPRFERAASRVGAHLASHGIALVYGGGHVGLMGSLANATLAAGGQVIGVIPAALRDKELAHEGVTALHVVASMHERKQLMADLGDGFIALPGGIGTLEELFETLTWLQLGFHSKPVGLLNVAGFYDPLIRFLENMVMAGLLRAEHLDYLIVESEIEPLLRRMAGFEPMALEKWITTLPKPEER
jgi:uncharacterized protein (TIGR00730 family)